MNKFLKITFSVVSTIIILVLFSTTPISNRSVKENSDIKVVIVNEDQGVEIDGELHILSQPLINSLVNDSEFDVSVMNYADAFEKLENNELMYIIIFDREFSNNINSFKTLDPNQGLVTYYYNQSYNESTNDDLKAEQARSEMFAEITNKITIAYNKTVINEIEESKQTLRENLNDNISDVSEAEIAVYTSNTKLTNTVTESNSFITGFDSQMNEKIGNLADASYSSQEFERSSIELYNTQAQASSDNIDNFTIIASSSENSINQNKDNFVEFSNTYVSNDGYLSLLKNKYASTYNAFGTMYSNTTQEINNIIDVNNTKKYNQEFNICTDSELLNNIIQELQEIEVDYIPAEYDVSNTDVLPKVGLLNEEQIESIKNNATMLCNDGEIAAYENVASNDNMNELYTQFVENMHTDINKELENIAHINELDELNIETYLNNELLILGPLDEEGCPVPSTRHYPNLPEGETMEPDNDLVEVTRPEFCNGELKLEYVELTEDQIVELNAYRLFVSNISEYEFEEITDSDLYMEKNVIARFEELVNPVVLKEYLVYGGEFASIFDIIKESELQQLNGLNYNQETMFDYVASEMNANDSLETLYNNAIHIEVMAAIKDQSLNAYVDLINQEGTDKLTLSELNDEFLESINDRSIESLNYVNRYLDNHNNTITSVTLSKEQFLNELEEVKLTNESFIELSDQTIDNIDNIVDRSREVSKEHSVTMQFISDVYNNNQEIREVADENKQTFTNSIDDLKETNQSQESFISEYSNVLSYANVEGVNNDKFYEHIANPIKFDELKVNESGSVIDSFFTVLWYLLGILLVSVLYDSFKNTFVLNISSGDFKESRVISIINKYLVYAVLLILFVIGYSIVLINKYQLDSFVKVTLELLLVAVLITLTIRTLIALSKPLGYGITILLILMTYKILNTTTNNNLLYALNYPVLLIYNLIISIINGNNFGDTLKDIAIFYGIVTVIFIIIKKIVNYIKQLHK